MIVGFQFGKTKIPETNHAGLYRTETVPNSTDLKKKKVKMTTCYVCVLVIFIMLWYPDKGSLRKKGFIFGLVPEGT